MTAMRVEAASQISVNENCGLTSALHLIAAVEVIGCCQAASDPKATFKLSCRDLSPVPDIA